MLSDARGLTTAFVKGVFSRHSPTWNGADFDVWLRAVEAAVRADQIEKDAAIAAGEFACKPGCGFSHTPTAETHQGMAAAIRAQLTERNDDE